MSDTPVTIGMTPCHPGEFIRAEVLDELHLSVTKAAQLLGVGRQALSDLVNGNHRLTPEMALRLEKAFGLDMDTMLRMQAWWDACAMRERADTVDVRPYMPAAS